MNSGIFGKGKTFAGAAILILGGALDYFGALPPGVSLGLPPSGAVAGGLIALGLGAKLQRLINMLAR